MSAKTVDLLLSSASVKSASGAAVFDNRGKLNFILVRTSQAQFAALLPFFL